MSAEPLQGLKAIFFDVADTLYSNEELEKQYPLKLIELLVREKRVEAQAAEALLKATIKSLESTEKHVTKVRAMRELGFTRDQVHAAYAEVNPTRLVDLIFTSSGNSPAVH